MKILLFTLFAICLTLSSCQDVPQTDESEPVDMPGNISNWIVDTLTEKIQFLFKLFDVKVRLVRLVRQLYTTENLVTLNKVLEIGSNVSNFLLRFLPKEDNNNNSGIFAILFGGNTDVDGSETSDSEPLSLDSENQQIVPEKPEAVAENTEADEATVFQDRVEESNEEMPVIFQDKGDDNEIISNLPETIKMLRKNLSKDEENLLKMYGERAENLHKLLELEN